MRAIVAGVGLLLLCLPAGAAPSQNALGNQISVVDEQLNGAQQRLDTVNADVTATGLRIVHDTQQLTVARQVAAHNAAKFYEKSEADDPFGISQIADPTTPFAIRPYVAAVSGHDTGIIDRLTAATRELRHAQARLAGDQRRVALLTGVLRKRRDRIEQLNAQVQSGRMFVTTDLAAWPDVPAPNPKAAIALAYAKQQLGKPYIYGGVGPAGYDCSGLVMMAWAQAGVSMPHGSIAQSYMFPRVAADQMEPGDLVVYYGDHHHIAMYIGDGLTVVASSTGTPIRIQAIYGAFQYAVRPG